MIKYSGNTINDWNFNEANINKVYYGTTNTSRLPSGYTEVEYVENQSQAFINTGFKPNQDTRIVCKMQTVTSTSGGRFIGAGGYDKANAMQFDYELGATGTLHISWGASAGWTTYSSCVGDYNIHVYDWDKNYFYRDRGEANEFSANTSYSSFQCTDNLGIFTRLQNGSGGGLTECLQGNLYYFKIYDNGVLIRDFVPCTRDSDSKAGVYDIVNDVFYSSANNYQLVAGPTVPASISGNLVYQKVASGDAPTPPTPKFEGKWVGYYPDSSVGFSADCDSSTAITQSQVRQTNYTNFSKIIIGDCVESIREAFQRCSALTEVEIGSGVTTNLYYAFEWNLALTSVTWYATNLTDYQDGDFQQCQNLQRLIMHSTTCPEASITTFNGVPSTMIIYVPDESISAYQNANYWNRFTIKGLSEL